MDFLKIQVWGFSTPSLKYINLVELEASRSSCSLTSNVKSTSSQKQESKVSGRKQHQTEQMAAPDHARKKKWCCQKCKEFIQLCLMLFANFPKS